MDGLFIPDSHWRKGENTFRIFRYNKLYSRDDDGGLVTFSAVEPLNKELPVNYWLLPVPCTVIFYLFLLGAQKLEQPAKFTWLEIIIAQDIYKRLHRIVKFTVPRPVIDRTLSEPPSVRRAGCRRHLLKGSTKHYCQKCYRLVPLIPIIQPDFEHDSTEDEQSISRNKRVYDNIQDSVSDPGSDDEQINSSEDDDLFLVERQVPHERGTPVICHSASS
jgi:hypothetical protein